MSKVKTLIHLLKTPKKLVKPLAANRLINWMPDKCFAKIVYKSIFNKELNLEAPESFNEKLQWLKLYYRKAELSELVDKLRVRDYIKENIGEEYLIPLIGVWKNADEIDFDTLPNQFVLKCNHDQGSVVICRDKSNLDIEKIRRKLNKRVKLNHYWPTREWPYKNIKPCIIGEKYMSNDSGEDELSDYKVLCFGGEPKLIEVHKARFSDFRTQDFYDVNWEKTCISQVGLKNSEGTMEKPVFLDQMLKLSRVLAKDMPHVRVDWYYAEGQLFFSELTFYDGGGWDPFDNSEDDILLGSWLQLPQNKVLR